MRLLLVRRTPSLLAYWTPSLMVLGVPPLMANRASFLMLRGLALQERPPVP